MTDTDDIQELPKKRLLSLKFDYLFRRIFGDAEDSFRFYLIHSITQRCRRESVDILSAHAAWLASASAEDRVAELDRARRSGR